MGNLTASCSVTNNSKRNVRVFVTDKSLEMDAFIASQSGGNDKITAVLPGGKKFIFRKEVKHVRVLASQTQPVPLESNPINASHFVSVFVEDEEDENICSKQIMHNMPLSGAATLLLYDSRSHDCCRTVEALFPPGGRLCFYVSYALCLCLGLLCLLFVSYWSSHWRGGFSWDGSALQFNWHPVLMVSGLVVLYGNVAVVYRVPFTWKQEKHIWKVVHAGLMLLALLLSVLGLCAVFDFHRVFHISDMYSVHSWVGICTVVMFTLQWVLGLAGFLLPCSPPWFRSTLKPVHIWMGKAILILSVTSCISGINEELLFSLDGVGGKPYSSLPAEAKFANSLGLLIVAFGLVVFGILSKDKWRRPETDGTEVFM
ncbi:lysosomal membrane ascorbate-dependent ferrireductase CYB561A3-like [Sebastes fasciatus]|uniref:lysosomal membrane ascorbate-dependent ferrireductase CYB561A3-like n=1 Tax=Sebastes fasciatus TaxID=394691 RepID=UPI003D9F7F88